MVTMDWLPSKLDRCQMSIFVERIKQACEASESLLCVGLDPDPALMPVPDAADFNRAIVDATAQFACAYKPNLAFYEALGMPGLLALERTIDHIRSAAPEAVVIGDAKRGDIGPSAKAYAKAMFKVWGFDAVTVNAWGGSDSIEPFLEDEAKGVFVWCRGSNPGSGDADAAIRENGKCLPAMEHPRQRRVGCGGHRSGTIGGRSWTLPCPAPPGAWGGSAGRGPGGCSSSRR